MLAGLGRASASIVGASLGGWLAVDYATRRPGRVERRALLDPGGIGRQRWGTVLLVLLLLPFGSWGKRTGLRLYLGRPPEAAPAPGLRRYLEHLLLVQRHFRPRRERLPVFADDALRTLTMPVLVIAGAPHAIVRLLPGVGHFPGPQTAPIHDFLRHQANDPPGHGLAPP